MGKGILGAREGGRLTGTADRNIPGQCRRLSFPVRTAAVDQGWCEKQQAYTRPRSSANEIISRLAVPCWPPACDSTGSTWETAISKAVLVNVSGCEGWATPPAQAERGWTGGSGVPCPASQAEGAALWEPPRRSYKKHRLQSWCKSHKGILPHPYFPSATSHQHSSAGVLQNMHMVRVTDSERPPGFFG